MSKRNFILLIIVLTIIIIAFFGYFYFYKKNNPIPDNGGTNFFFDFNPFNTNKNKTPTGTNPTDVSGYVPEGDNTQNQNAQLMKVSSMPVAGYGIFMKERFKEIPAIVSPTTTPATDTTTPTQPTSTKGTPKPTAPLTEFVPALRYVARATGNIYQTFADKIDERKFSNTLVPKVYEAFFGNKAESVIMRYLKEDERTIATFVGALPKEYLGSDTATDNEIKGSFLSDNISDLTLSPDSSNIFYLLNTKDGSIGITSGTLGEKRTQVFDSSFTEWLSSWPTSKMITINTKPSGSTPGYVYAIDTSKKDLTRIFGGINGLTTLTSPNGKLMLYGDSSLSLSVYRIDTGEIEQVGVRTLPEKCVWGGVSDTLYCSVPKYVGGALYPDSWYKGETSFSDEIWKVDLTTGNTTKIVDPASVGGGEIDGIKLGLDNDENYLFFINKKDSYLWKLNLK